MKSAIPSALIVALLLSACSAPSTPGADPAPLDDLSTQTELGGAVASDIEQTLATLSDTGPLAALGLCRTADPASSKLGPDGKPLDTDQDSVPDNVTWIHANCQRGGLTVGGRTTLSDPTPDTALAGSFIDTSHDLSLSYTRADSTVRTALRNGTSSGTLRNHADLTIVRNVTETVTDTAHPARQATWNNRVTVQYTAAPGQRVNRRAALPAGTVAVNGPREWHVSNGAQHVDRFLQIVTTTPIAFDPTCHSQADRIFGSSHARSGAFQVLVYAEAAHATLQKTITVTYADCVPTITTR